MPMAPEAAKSFTDALPPEGRPYAAVFLELFEKTGEAPELLAAIVERESYYGTARGYFPKGRGGRGDNGHGHGLWQIDDGSHQAFLAAKDAGGKPLWTDPKSAGEYAVNSVIQPARAFFSSRDARPFGIIDSRGSVLVSSAWSQGSREKYGFNAPTGKYADPRPLTGEALGRAVVASYNAGVNNVLRTIAAGFPADKRTTGGDYATDVLRRAARISRAMREGGVS